MDFNIGDEVRKQIEDAFRKRGRKSTLINAIFHGRIAETGQGRPVTQEAREYTKEGVPVTLIVWESPGSRVVTVGSVEFPEAPKPGH